MLKQSAEQKRRRYRVRALTVVGLALLIFIPWVLKKANSSSSQAFVDTGAVSTSSVAGTQVIGVNLKNFSNDEFKQLYESLALPNTELIASPPSITGNIDADLRIRQVAESRGYKLRSLPVMPIVKTNVVGLEEDDLLQPKAFEAWQKLSKAAKQQGVPLTLNSGYRSIDWQRSFFNAQLQARGLSVLSIGSGQADDAIADVMNVVAPPGYSRHHTGYTVDVICNDGTGRSFEYTACFDWLKSDNYKNAKEHGWIPSYPEGVKKQGPEPEPWEYVWVGTGATHE